MGFKDITPICDEKFVQVVRQKDSQMFDANHQYMMVRLDQIKKQNDLPYYFPYAHPNDVRKAYVTICEYYTSDATKLVHYVGMNKLKGLSIVALSEENPIWKVTHYCREFSVTNRLWTQLTHSGPSTCPKKHAITGGRNRAKSLNLADNPWDIPRPADQPWQITDRPIHYTAKQEFEAQYMGQFSPPLAPEENTGVQINPHYEANLAAMNADSFCLDDLEDEDAERIEEAMDYRHTRKDYSCSCHISPPCNVCMHPGSPASMEAQDCDEDGVPMFRLFKYKKKITESEAADAFGSLYTWQKALNEVNKTLPKPKQEHVFERDWTNQHSHMTGALRYLP